MFYNRNFKCGWCFAFTLKLFTILSKLFHHFLFFLLDSHVLVVSPFVENFHGLNVFDGCELVSVVLITTQRIQVNLFAKTCFVFSLDKLKNVNYLFAVVNFIIIDTNYRMEYGPHDFWIIHFTSMVANV